MNTLISSIIIFANDDGGFKGTINNKSFWDTSFGSALAALMGVIGILVVVYAVIKGVKNISTGKVADSVKGIIGAVLLAAVLFNPPIIQNAVAAGSKVMNAAISTISDIASTGGGSTSSNTGDAPDSKNN